MLTEQVVQYLMYFVIFLIVIVLAYGTYISFQHWRYDHIPGPTRTSFWLGNTRELVQYVQEHGNFHTLLVSYFRQYGHTIKFFIFHYVMVFTIDKDAIKEILMSEKYTKSREYNHIRRLYGVRIFGSGLVTELDHQKWWKKRTRMNPFFTRSAIKQYEECIEKNADRLLNKLESFCAEKTFSFQQEMRRVTLDIITQILFSDDFNVINDDQSPVFVVFNHLFEAMHQSFYFPTLKFDPRYTQYRKATRESVIVVRQQLTTMVQTRLGFESADRDLPDDFLTAMVRLLENYPETPMEEIVDDLFTALIAGHDTVASHLSMVVLLLNKHTDVMRKVYKELDETVGQKQHITYEDISKLTYLNAVIKETLRMYPSGPEISRQSDTNTKIRQYTVPAGTPLKISLFACSRMEDCFENPDVFDPERFLGEESQRPSTSYSYIPFSLGNRGCLGQHFAKVETRIILVKLLQKFTFDLAPNQSYKIVQLLTLQIQDGLKLKLHRRPLKH